MRSTPETSPVEVVGCAEGSVENLESNIFGFDGEEFEGVHDKVRGGTGEDPGDSVGLLFLGLGVHEVIKLFLH